MAAQVDAAEKEASEVLHSLLSVERIEKQELMIEDEPKITQTFEAQNPTNTNEDQPLQWHSSVPLGTHSLFSTIDSNNHFTQSIEDPQVIIWDGTIQVEPEEQKDMYNTEIEEDSEPTKKQNSNPLEKQKPLQKTKKKIPIKKKKKGDVNSDPTKLEDSAIQVKERFKRGCECHDESCFRGLNPENVYKHRLNIAELTKGEHDMYLMGVTMACLANPDTTVRHKERRRLRAQYVYQGRRVCLDAFLYLENCTHYQLKRIRKHVMTHGVTPRVHGNYGKKPHNTFPLDIYRHATEFLKQYLEQHTGEKDICNTKNPIVLPWDITRKNLHDSYKEYSQLLEPGTKLMGYSTFRHFMKEQFPNVKFCKVEPKSNSTITHNQNQQQTQQIQDNQIHNQIQKQHLQTIEVQRDQQVRKCVISEDVQQVIPLVVTQNDGSATQQHQQTFLVTPVPQLLPNGNIITTQNANNHTANTFSYQLTNTGYVINEQGNIVTTMANAQHHTPYTFSRM